MATSNVPSSGPPDYDAANTLVQTESNATRYDMTDEKLDAEFLDARHNEAGPSLMVGDVAIPAGLLRAANMPQEWAPDVETSEEPFRRSRGGSADFSVWEIALEQRRQFEENLADNSTDTPSRQHRVSWDLEAGAHKHRSQDQGLPTLVEGTKSDFEPSPFRWSARGLTPFRTNSNNNVRPSPPAVVEDQPQSDTVLFRSLNNYALNEKSIDHRRRSSNAVAPDGDYFGVYEDPFASDADNTINEKLSPVASPLSETATTRAQESRTAALARLCMGNNRNTDSVISALPPRPRQGTQGSVRRNSLLDVYDKAKIHGQNFQRKKWVQVTFEYTFYLLILCFIYFVLVGRPIWNGAVWYLYWVVNNKFTIAGTWSITIGLALFYAYAPLLILFEKEPPMNTDDIEAQATQTSDTTNTALLIPCYKSANIIGPTLAAALKIFPAKNIFVIANGNSPTPLDNTEEVCRTHGVNHVWCPIGSKIVAQYVGCYAAKGYTNVLLIDDDCALPPNFPIVSDRLEGKVKVIGYTIKSVGPDSSKGTMCQQAQDLEYKISGLQRELAGKIGSATFPHGAISLWNTRFLIETFRTHPGFSVSEDWFFGHAARQLGSRIKMCSAVFVETETPSAILFSSGGARGGFGEMTIFKQRFYRWNFFFVNGMFYNLSYIFTSWKLGFWELGAKIFVFQEVYETLLYLFAPFVLPISLIVRPAFCAYLMLGTLGLYFVNVTIFNEIHLRRRNERVNWVVVYVYYTPYKILLTLINVFSCYYSLWKYASYFAKRHPKIVEDEKAIEVVLRLEDTKPASDNAPGRRLTVTTIGSRVSWDNNNNNKRHSRNSRNSRTSNPSISIAPGGGDLTSPPKVLLLQRLPSTAESEHETRSRPISVIPDIPGAEELMRTDTVDFAEPVARRDTDDGFAEKVIGRIHDL